MNPFEEFEDNNTVTKQSKIEIWVETFGRKKNTFVTGWNIPLADLKSHIKNIKKKNGCNGTVKKIEDDKKSEETDSEDKNPNDNEETPQTTSDDDYMMLFQGDHSEYVKNYIIESGVSVENIRIKG